MAKNVRWKIPFVSTIDNYTYRIDIYDDGWNGGITELVGGPSPITTEENQNEDIFTPVRSQTGTIQVCTAIPSGGLLTLEDLLPKNNTDRPVKLVYVDGSDETICWQGFLSSEAYSQDYVGNPQILEIPILSILEAMDSVECDINNLNGVQKIHTIIGYTLEKIQGKYGSYFSDIYISGEGVDLLKKYINTSIFYDVKKRSIETYTEEYMEGITLKKIIEIIASYAGWCVREQYGTFFFQTAGSDHRLLRTTITELLEEQPSLSTFDNIYVENINGLTWRGIGHQKSVYQGARNVEVIANLHVLDVSASIPSDFPRGDYMEGSMQYVSKGTGNDGADQTVTLTAYASKEQDEVSNRYEFHNWYQYDKNDRIGYEEKGTAVNVFSDTKPGGETSLNPIGDQYLGAIFMRLVNKSINFDENGLYFNAYDFGGYPNDQDLYVFKMRSINYLNAYSGKLILTVDGYTYSTLAGFNKFSNIVRDITVAIKWGSKYLNADLETWSSSLQRISLEWNETNKGQIEIPITSYNIGELEVMAYPKSLTWFETDMSTGRNCDEYLLTDFSIKYEAPEDAFKDDGTNTYFRPLLTSFNGNKSINLEIASSLKNIPNPSLILNQDPDNSYDPLITMDFYGDIQREIRPELYLLWKMEKYYRLPRTILKLEVNAPEDLIAFYKYIGINDNKVYLPMSATVNWREDTATITYIEIPPWLEIKTSPTTLWIDNFDRIELSPNSTTKVIYISSPVDVTWEDRTGHLSIVRVNGISNGGVISKGTDVSVAIELSSVGSDERGNIDFYQNGELVYSIDVVIRS